MNEEMMTMIEENEDVEVNATEETNNSGSGILGKVILGIIGVGAATAGVLYATRNKREEARIARLEKKGYVVTRPVVEVPVDQVVEVKATEDAE